MSVSLVRFECVRETFLAFLFSPSFCVYVFFLCLCRSSPSQKETWSNGRITETKKKRKKKKKQNDFVCCFTFFLLHYYSIFIFIRIDPVVFCYYVCVYLGESNNSNNNKIVHIWFLLKLRCIGIVLLANDLRICWFITNRNQ